MTPDKEALEHYINAHVTIELHRKEERDEYGTSYWYEGTLPDDELDDIDIKVDIHGNTFEILCEGIAYISVSPTTLSLMNILMEFIDSMREKMLENENYVPPHIVRINPDTEINLGSDDLKGEGLSSVYCTVDYESIDGDVETLTIRQPSEEDIPKTSRAHTVYALLHHIDKCNQEGRPIGLTATNKYIQNKRLDEIIDLPEFSDDKDFRFFVENQMGEVNRTWRMTQYSNLSEAFFSAVEYGFINNSGKYLKVEEDFEFFLDDIKEVYVHLLGRDISTYRYLIIDDDRFAEEVNLSDIFIWMLYEEKETVSFNDLYDQLIDETPHHFIGNEDHFHSYFIHRFAMQILETNGLVKVTEPKINDQNSRYDYKITTTEKFRQVLFWG